MTNRDTLEDMLATIARAGARDEFTVRALFEDPQPVDVLIGQKGIALALGKAVSILTFEDGAVNSGVGLKFGTIAPIDRTFSLGPKGNEYAPIETPAATPDGSDPVVIEGLPRRKRGESGRLKAALAAPTGEVS